MKILITFKLCLALILQAIPVSAVAQTCPTGQEFNQSLNRCLTSAEAARVKSAAAYCESYPAQERAGCVQRNAAQELQNLESDKKVKEKDSFFRNEEGKVGAGAAAANAAAVAVPLFLLGHNLIKQQQIKKSSRGKFKYKCSPPSMILLYGGAGTLLAGEVVTYIGHKKRLKKLYAKNDEFNKKHADGKATVTSAQGEAFEVLAENEESIADVVKTKKGFYAAGTGVFAASAIAAVVEKISLKGLKKSYAAATDPGTKQAILSKIKNISCSQDQLVKDEELNQLNNEANSEEAGLNEKLAKKEELIKEKEAQEAEWAAEDAKAEEPVKPVDKTNPKKPETSDNYWNNGNKNKEPGNENYWNNGNKNKKPGNENYWNDGNKNKKPENENYWNTGIKTENTITAYELMDRVLSEYDRELRNYVLIENRAAVEKELTQLKAISLSRSIMQQFIPEAFAQDEETVYTLNKNDGVYYDKNGKAAEGMVDPKTGKLRKADMLNEVVITAGPSKEKLLGQVGEIKKAIQLVNGKKVDISKIEGQVNNQVSKFIGEPVNRAILAGVIGGWVGVMTSHFAKQQKISQERADQLRKVKESLNSGGGICTGIDCMGGTKGGRTLSSADFDADKKVCLTEEGDIDRTCGCRSNGTCKSFSGMKLKLSPSTLKMMSAVSGPARDLSVGNFAPGEFDAAAILSNSSHAMRAAQKMNQSTETPKNAKKLAAATQSAEKALGSLGGGMAMPGMSGSGSDASSGGLGSLPSSPAEAAKKIEEDIVNPVKYSQGGAGFQGTSGDEEIPAMPDLAGNNSGPSIEEQEFLVNSMEKQTDYDVNKAKDVNIFETLSHRYRASGLKKLQVEP